MCVTVCELKSEYVCSFEFGVQELGSLCLQFDSCNWLGFCSCGTKGVRAREKRRRREKEEVIVSEVWVCK